MARNPVSVRQLFRRFQFTIAYLVLSGATLIGFLLLGQTAHRVAAEAKARAEQVAAETRARLVAQCEQENRSRELTKTALREYNDQLVTALIGDKPRTPAEQADLDERVREYKQNFEKTVIEPLGAPVDCAVPPSRRR